MDGFVSKHVVVIVAALITAGLLWYASRNGSRNGSRNEQFKPHRPHHRNPDKLNPETTLIARVPR